MKKETLLSAIKSLIMMFPQKQIDVSVMYECLKDLTDDQFNRGFKSLLQETEKIDASTNIISIIRKVAVPKIVWKMP